jgi:hypothetical protein
MIINAFALLSLFMGILTVCLITAAAFSAVYFYRRLKRSDGPDERGRAENGIHLSLLLIFTAFILRLISWPLFYFLLYSFVPLVPGAMCIYGVTRVMPVFVEFMQVLKPAAFFLVGGWLIFHQLDLSLKTHPLLKKSIRFLIIVSAIAWIDGAAEILFSLTFSPPGVAVSCCTAVADIALPASSLFPVPFFGVQYHGALMVAYHGFNIGLIVLTGFMFWRRQKKREWTPTGFMLFLTAVLAFSNGVITYGAFKERIGPRLMGLPDHHCLYCLLQYRPVSIVILGLLILGSYLAMWPFFLNKVAASNTTEERLSVFTQNLFKSAFVCLLASWLLTALTGGVK